MEIQIGDDLFIAPVTEEEREGSMLYTNHCCDPNLGMRGEITFVAMRDIRAEEELTHDWAMTDDDDYSVECNCGVTELQENSHWQGLATPGVTSSLCGIFLGISREENCEQKLACGLHGFR